LEGTVQTVSPSEIAGDEKARKGKRIRLRNIL